MKIIARIESDFKEKFGIPRQSGIADELRARIVFLPEYRKAEAFRGLEGFSHIWLIWQFSEAEREEWSPTVRPPRLGGNKRMGVFATRSPYRPNPIGLSSVRLLSVEYDQKLGPVLNISGADLLDGTPIYDIKPYLAYTDSHPDAVGGFADPVREYGLRVEISEAHARLVPEEKREGLMAALGQDPRPSYQDDPTREYGMRFADLEVKFKVIGDLLRVTDIRKVRSHEIF